MANLVPKVSSRRERENRVVDLVYLVPECFIEEDQAVQMAAMWPKYRRLAQVGRAADQIRILSVLRSPARLAKRRPIVTPQRHGLHQTP